MTDTTRNDGSASTGGSTTTRFYLSTDQVRNSGDLSMSGVRTVTTLAVGTQSAGSVTVTVPTGAAFGTSYFVLACADDNDTVDEINEGNNCLASAGSVQILGPDLQVTAVSNPPATAARGSTFTVTDTTRNNGAATTGNSSSTRYYFSTDTSLSSGDRRLTGTRSVATLSAGTQSSGSVSVQVPTTTTSGQYWLLACADDQTDVDEVNESNNCLASTTRVTVPGS